MCDHQTTSLSSFVFPKEALQKKQPRSLEKEKRKRTDKVTFCALTSKPFQQDVVELKVDNYSALIVCTRLRL